jgi:hexulose-6-phosphate isomerase
VQSLTGDNFMHAPFWKAHDSRAALLDDARAILASCRALGVRFVVVPLVDAGRVENDAQEASLFDGLAELAPVAAEGGVKIVFESDLEPEPLAAFVARLPADRFGINYDSGNSAGLGYDTRKEIAAYGDRIDNVHIKDRQLHGTTVPLGAGNADLPATVAALKATGYQGDYILQTARAADGDDVGAAVRYRDLVRGLLDPLGTGGQG